MGNMKRLAFGLVLGLTLSTSAFAVEFDTIRGNMGGMTSIAWKSYTGSLKGQSVSWTGWVKDVTEQWTGGYKLLIDMDPPGSVSVQDIYVEDLPADIAGQFQKNQRLSFSGKIKSVHSVLGSCGITLEQTSFNK
jgi:hypothetical protein